MTSSQLNVAVRVHSLFSRRCAVRAAGALSLNTVLLCSWLPRVRGHGHILMERHSGGRHVSGHRERSQTHAEPRSCRLPSPTPHRSWAVAACTDRTCLVAARRGRAVRRPSVRDNAHMLRPPWRAAGLRVPTVLIVHCSRRLGAWPSRFGWGRAPGGRLAQTTDPRPTRPPSRGHRPSPSPPPKRTATEPRPRPTRPPSRGHRRATPDPTTEPRPPPLHARPDHRAAAAAAPRPPPQPAAIAQAHGHRPSLRPSGHATAQAFARPATPPPKPGLLPRHAHTPRDRHHAPLHTSVAGLDGARVARRMGVDLKCGAACVRRALAPCVCRGGTRFKLRSGHGGHRGERHEGPACTCPGVRSRGRAKVGAAVCPRVRATTTASMAGRRVRADVVHCSRRPHRSPAVARAGRLAGASARPRSTTRLGSRAQRPASARRHGDSTLMRSATTRT
jgi:hypothetical protein